MPSENRSRDLVIPPGRYIHVLDKTKGHVQTLTGPNKNSMSDTEIPVIWDPTTNSYRCCENPEEAVRQNVLARLGEYVVLTNPAAADRQDAKHPEDGKSSLPPKLDVGSNVVIPGPVSFALWWQQGAIVIAGHQLRSNQFVVVEVTNDKLAKENWDKAIFKRTIPQKDSGPAASSNVLEDINPENFTMGQRIIIRGTEVSFFIPPTGMRVVPENKDQFVREAVTLESLQYCVLKDENGKKNFVSGPAVVFPKPTETFIEEQGSRVFKAIELNPNSGIHVMVIADYADGGRKVEAGTELFITGATTPIYYPRPEHAIIKYDETSIVHFATAVPAGEGRYVMNKKTGEPRLVVGPRMLLLNAVDDVFVRRVLSDKQVSLWYPNNSQAIEFNRGLARELGQSTMKRPGSEENEVRPIERQAFYARNLRSSGESAVAAAVADSIERRSTYTPPRTITLGTKYEGAVAVGVWQGFAVQVVSKSGARRVEIGPKTVLLAYDEELTQLSLSTGKPKSADNLQETVYLRLAGNQVGDIIKVETQDGIEINVRLAYQVEFTSDNTKWFDVDNYVKLITDHCRSILRGMVKKVSVADFVANNTSMIRDVILGIKTGEVTIRPGMMFPQNNARIYDVEVLAVDVVDRDVAGLIRASQQTIVRGNLELTANQHKLKVTREGEDIARQIITEQMKTGEVKHQVGIASERQKLEMSLASQKVRDDVTRAAREAELGVQKITGEIHAAQLLREKAKADQEHVIDFQIQELVIRKTIAETEAVKARLEAVKPELVRAIQASDDREALVAVASQLGIAAYLKDHSVGVAVEKILQGTGLGETFKKLSDETR